MDSITYIRSMVGKSQIFLSCAGCMIANDKNEILLQQRSDSGLWGLPGGVMELGESMAETAVRETYEETGLLVEIDKLQGIYSKYFAEYPNGDQAQPVLAIFHAHIIGGELKYDEKETMKLAYFSKDTLPELFCRQHEDIIEDYFRGETGCFR